MAKMEFYYTCSEEIFPGNMLMGSKLFHGCIISYHFVVAIVLDMIFEIPSLRVRSQKSDLLVSLISLKKHFFIVVFYIICYIHMFILIINDNCTFIFHNA